MREIGDSSSAGSTPPPPNLDHFSPTNFLADPVVSPKATAADDDLWKHLADDGWYFWSDNLHDSQSYLFNVSRAAASEPLCQKNAGSRRPPRPCAAAARKRKHKVGTERIREGTITAYSSHQHHQLISPPQQVNNIFV